MVPVYLQILGPGMGVRCEGGVFKGALRAYLDKNERHTAGWGGKEEEPKSESDAAMHPLFPKTHILSHIRSQQHEQNQGTQPNTATAP